MEHVSSRQNPVVMRFRQLAGGDSEGQWMLLDGEHLAGEAVRSNIRIEVAAFSMAAAERLDALRSQLERSGSRVITVSDQVLDVISPVRHPSGVAAIAARPAFTLDQALEGTPPLALILAGVQDPGNVGAIIRAAEGCGASGVVATGGTADPFGWKALRGAMGSAFRLPVATRHPLDVAIARARAAGLRVLATTAHNGTPLPSCDLRRGCAILLGAEGSGLPAAVVSAADERLVIPMHAPVESLNVAIAAALVLYEAGRQRTDPAARPRSADVAV